VKSEISQVRKFHLTPVYEYIVPGNPPKKLAVFGCLTNAIAPLPIAQESCSNLQTIRWVF